MPFDLFISRAPSLDEALRPRSSQRQNPMTWQEFGSVMASAPVAVTMRPDGDAWLRHLYSPSPSRPTPPPPSGDDGSVSSKSRTRDARPSCVTGFWIISTPASSRPWCTMAFRV